MTYSLILLNKSCDDKALQIDIFTNKLDNLDNTTLLCAFFAHFDFESVLSSNTRSWRGNIYYSQSVAEAISVSATIFFLSSPLFFLLHDKHFETNEKISNRIEASHTSFYNLSTGMMYDGLDESRTAFDALASFCSLQCD